MQLIFGQTAQHHTQLCFFGMLSGHRSMSQKFPDGNFHQCFATRRCRHSVRPAFPLRSYRWPWRCCHLLDTFVAGASNHVTLHANCTAGSNRITG